MAHLKSIFLGLFGIRKSVQVEAIPRQVVVRNLLDANSILSSLGICCWLTDGTLLGFFRDDDLIEHDKDVDLGVRIGDYSEAIIPEFEKNGFEIKYVLGERKQGLELSFIRGGVKVDLFFFYREGDRMWHGAWQGVDRGRKRNLIKYYYDAFDLREAEFLGEKFFVPADTLKYIETKYGKDWRTPVREWDWAFGPANAVGTDVVRGRNKKKIVR